MRSLACKFGDKGISKWTKKYLLEIFPFVSKPNYETSKFFLKSIIKSLTDVLFNNINSIKKKLHPNKKLLHKEFIPNPKKYDLKANISF